MFLTKYKFRGTLKVPDVIGGYHIVEDQIYKEVCNDDRESPGDTRTRLG
jgi:hypothetical protein